MKGYSRLATAQAAAGRLIERGYAVTVDKRNGWYVLNATMVQHYRAAAPPPCALCVDGDCTGRCDQNPEGNAA